MLKSAPDAVESTTAQKFMVVYETPAAREYAADVCEHVVGLPADAENFWWISCEELGNTRKADAALRAAENADVIIIAANAEDDFEPVLKLWIERWLAKRHNREGTLAGIFEGEGSSIPGVATQKEIYLRHVAHRAEMDFISHLPTSFRKTVPESLDDFSTRAQKMTHVLDEILHTKATPRIPLL
jgi:hypothetical protein